MSALKFISSIQLAMIAGSSLLWILLPQVFQLFLQSLTSTESPGPFLSTTSLTLILMALVSFVFFMDFQKFKHFIRKKPSHSPTQSLVSRLAQDRIWATDFPSFLGSLIISIGGIAVLFFRDSSLALLVIFWFLISYSLQKYVQRSVTLLSQRFSQQKNRPRVQIKIQNQLLTQQVFASGLSNTLRVSGQVLIYLLLFYEFTQNERAGLPVIIANIEYVALTLSHLQMAVSSLPKLQELQVYLEIKKNEEPKAPHIQSAS